MYFGELHIICQRATCGLATPVIYFLFSKLDPPLFSSNSSGLQIKVKAQFERSAEKMQYNKTNQPTNKH